MDKIIKFDSEGLLGLHFYEKGLNYPVVIGTYSEWQEIQISYLTNYIENNYYNTESICIWCISHGIPYQIIYPTGKKSIFKNPYKYFKYLQLKKKLNKL